MLRVKTEWTVPPGGTGLSVMHMGLGESFDATDASNACTRVNTFLLAIKAELPPSASVKVQSTADIVSTAGDTLGTLPGAVFGTSPGTSATTTYAAGVGARIRWITGGMKRGRHVTGTTFIVPLPTSAYEANGTLTSGIITALQTAATDLIANLTTDGIPLLVWSRPEEASEDWPAFDGDVSVVTGASITDKVAWLRTRKV